VGSQATQQFERTLNIDTPLGADKLLLMAMSGQEGVSQLFQFNLELVSEDGNISFDDIVGKNCTIRIKLAEEGKFRYINGHISRFAQVPSSSRMYHYQAELVPWVWFLTRASDCKIFQEKTVPDIIKKVFADLGFQDYADDTQGSFDPWEYCVQYRETSFNFVSRLMEEEGISYYFRHEDGKHTLVMFNAPSAVKPCEHAEKVRYERTGGEAHFRFDEDVVLDFRLEEELRTGKYTQTDYNFKTPHTSLLSTVASTVSIGGNSRFELYDFPGEYETKGQGEQWTKLRMEEEESPHRVGTGQSLVRAFTPGYKFELSNAARSSQNGMYMLTRVLHDATETEFHSGEGSTFKYTNQFTCVPAGAQYRPPRTTPKPLIHGMQTAFVVGPSGEEIYVDKYGRVKVHFHWDRVGKKDGTDTCWIRVAQPWAGKNWGHMWIPRIGHEVVVDFLEGDPDRPLIRCSVYNDDNMPPYTLPDFMTVSTMKSRSTKQGGTSNWNEIRMEDKKGSEQLFIHAEKDMDLSVENESRTHVQARQHIQVDKDSKELLKANRHLHVKGNHMEAVDGDMSLKVNGSQQEKVGIKYAQDVGQEIHLKSGMKVVIEAGMEITIKGAGGFIKIDPMGVTIVGTMVMINSGGAPGAGSGSSPTAPEDPDVADDGSKFSKM
jgi:type VI secretion system secreted protein VgrG